MVTYSKRVADVKVGDFVLPSAFRRLGPGEVVGREQGLNGGTVTLRVEWPSGARQTFYIFPDERIDVTA